MASCCPVIGLGGVEHGQGLPRPYQRSHHRDFSPPSPSPLSGGVSSHGKAVVSMADPGRDAVVGLIAVLKMLRDKPEKINVSLPVSLL